MADFIIKSGKDLRAGIRAWRANGHCIGFVPTMGALHEGHLSLVNEAKKHADKIIASIFVNPAQFGEGEDLSAYPRSGDKDVKKLEKAGCHLVYMPDAETMYANGHATRISVGGPALGHETDYRPHFFGGVVLVVTKLFNRVQPDIAVFGEKDYQQLMTIRRLVRDLDFPIEVIGAPIVREKDGLAMSSRNRYFDTDSRVRAARLNEIMFACAQEIKNGIVIDRACEHAVNALLKAGYERVDYVTVTDPDSLAPLSGRLDAHPARLLVAASCSGVRLIDNCEIHQGSGTGHSVC